MYSGFHGKVALVTGAGSGMGRAAAQIFAREGAQVVVADIDPAGGEETVRLLREAGGEASFVRCDVSRAAEVEAMVRHAVERFGRLDCAFNHAGISAGSGGTTGLTEEEWDLVIDVNLKGVWLCMKYEIPPMLAQGGGAIVNTASVAGFIGQPRNPNYAASKHGVLGLTKSAALEHARNGIRVNAVCPGPIRTPMLERGIARSPDLEQALVAGQPNGRLGTAEEVAEAAVWLCSDAASNITGHPLVIDGGYLTR
jgi:NAD(P)-dependent dehydrogenase (short-subunit alcohol dehydrogenase family)